MTTVNNIATIVIAAIGGGAGANVNDWGMK